MNSTSHYQDFAYVNLLQQQKQQTLLSISQNNNNKINNNNNILKKLIINKNHLKFQLIQKQNLLLLQSILINYLIKLRRREIRITKKKEKFNNNRNMENHDQVQKLVKIEHNLNQNRIIQQQIKLNQINLITHQFSIMLQQLILEQILQYYLIFSSQCCSKTLLLYDIFQFQSILRINLRNESLFDRFLSLDFLIVF
ncbi:unnamed protein product [Paramecium primaurelia]|uniref:Uncharacterized protein n=1 Tax=Paramecium primaurelia TaxID=5886 RepID=A0A8S1K2H8_PARPR|nr:unnamed protein product [Paramecium primaurelia]